MNIRLMREEDIDGVRDLDSAAFACYYRGHGLARSPVRTAANVAWNLAKDPQGCFVAEEGEALVGFIFSRCWGAIGWSGTFGVRPDYQGRGVGKALLNRSIGYLEQRGCRFIGLETMPDSAYNVGLYLRCGYRPHGFTLRWTRVLGGVQPPAVSEITSRWASEVSAETWRVPLRLLGEAMLPGLDLIRECVCILEHRQGDVLLFYREGRLAGTAAIRMAPLFEDVSEFPAYAEFVVLAADMPVKEALGEIERRVSACGKGSIMIPTNSSDGQVEGVLLERGYRVSASGIRFLRTQSPVPLGTVCWRWAG